MGEFSRLLNIGTTSLEQSKFELTEDFCEQSGVTLVLKSASTLISSPGAETTLFHRPDSSLAKGGSGDVLAGIISALLAQGMEGFEAALNGVMLHSLTARHCRKQFSPYSVTPLDLIHALKGVTSLSPQQTQ
jgi:NAD(P)H-hydrate epimerase